MRTVFSFRQEGKKLLQFQGQKGADLTTEDGTGTIKQIHGTENRSAGNTGGMSHDEVENRFSA